MLTGRLGSSEIEVSRLSLGSWRTFERISRDDGLAVMRRAREVGITFLDDARYDDESGTAPMRTGWSEVVFGELFRAAGWRRDDVVVANKLWWEHWPGERAVDELEGSLSRMGLDELDLEYATPLPVGMTVEECVQEVGGLLASGKLRAWGTLNWSADDLATAVRVARAERVAPPCATQLPYNLVFRTMVEDPAMVKVLDDADIAVVASAVLAGGALSGRYATSASGRLGAQLDDQRVRASVAAGASLAAIAAERGTTAPALAIAFALANERVASVLFGASSPSQVSENAEALELVDGLDVGALVATL